MRLLAVENAIEGFFFEHRRLPHALDEIIGTDGSAFLRTDALPEDGWGNPILYERLDARRYTLVSLGADGRAGGDGEAADVDRQAARRRRRD